jgi:hypothetical protein
LRVVQAVHQASPSLSSIFWLSDWWHSLLAAQDATLWDSTCFSWNQLHVWLTIWLSWLFLVLWIMFGWRLPVGYSSFCTCTASLLTWINEAFFSKKKKKKIPSNFFNQIMTSLWTWPQCISKLIYIFYRYVQVNIECSIYANVNNFWRFPKKSLKK